MGTLALQDYFNQVQSLIHDYTNSAWSQAEITRRINDARKDVAMSCQCVRTLKTQVQLLTNQEIYSYHGAVGGAIVTAGGSNYDGGTTVPVSFGTPPAGGVQALGFGNLTNGALTSITMTQWGQGYTSTPTITIGGNGTGAAATAVAFVNVMNILSISVIWETMRYTLSFRGFGVFQAWARMLQSMGFQSEPGMWTIHQGDKFVYIDPPPNQIYPSEWDITTLPQTQLVNLTDIDYDIPDPYAEAVQFKAAHYLLLKHQNFAQANYYEEKYQQMVPAVTVASGGYRIPNPYNKSFLQKMRRT
jgi:hypothetical protein